jgi:hypothetical protein
MAKRSRQGQKQCPECNAWVKGTRTKECPKCSHQFNGKKKAAAAPKAPAPKPEPAQVVAEKPAKVGDIVTIAQVRVVAELVAVVGGFDRCHELLGVIREVGGLKRMKDLLEALAAAQVGPVKV